MTSVVLFQVGSPLPGWSGPRQERGHFNIDANGPRLDLCFRNPTNREVRGLRTGKARFGIVPAGKHTAFFLYDIESATEGWADASYSVGLLTPEEREMHPRTLTEGWLLNMLMVDADTGIIRALRQITFTPEFSNKLDGVISAQLAAMPDFTPQKHFAEVDAAYKRWPSTTDMLPFSLATERGGLPFEKFR